MNFLKEGFWKYSLDYPIFKIWHNGKKTKAKTEKKTEKQILPQ